VVDLLKIKERDRVEISVKGEKLIIEAVRNSIDLALHGMKNIFECYAKAEVNAEIVLKKLLKSTRRDIGT